MSSIIKTIKIVTPGISVARAKDTPILAQELSSGNG